MNPTAPLSHRQIFRAWWPLAISWALMAVELPVIGAVIARLADPEIHLAALGGVVFPVALVVESPIIMLLVASTALSRDWDSYLRLRRFMMWAGAALTVVHLLIALTPLYFVVVETLIRVPTAVVGPARIGLIIMLPCSWAIAYRRFNQGVLIRFGYSRSVGKGTALRLAAYGLVLAVGSLVGSFSAIVVATSAISAGVLIEALYVRYQVRPVLTEHLKKEAGLRSPVTLSSFARFYIPLALTPFLTLLGQPVGAAALSRMAQPLESLAVWPMVFGLLFLVRSVGFAYQEVVVAMLDEPKARRRLKQFTVFLTSGATLLLLLVSATPLAGWWFETVSGLRPSLSQIASYGLIFGLLIPGLGVLHNWYQGLLVHARRTRPITESVAIFLLTCSAILWLGVQHGQLTGLHIGLMAFTVGAVFQAIWLRLQTRQERVGSRLNV